MSRPVRIAVVSAFPLVLPGDIGDEEMLAAIVAHWRSRIAEVLPDAPDLIVLPEHGDRPWVRLEPVEHFPVDRIRRFTEFKGDRVRDALAEIAVAHRTRIAYSGYRLVDGSLRNSTQLVGIDGAVVATYDKNYLTIPEHGTRGVDYGASIPVFETDLGRIAMLICFDLNFVEAIPELERQRPELIVFSSAYHGGFVQQHWAYSTRAYLAASVYPPNTSGIVSPAGDAVATSTNYRHSAVATIDLDYAVVHIDRNMPAIRRAKQELGSGLLVHDPGRIGSLLLTAATPELRIDDILRDYGIQRLEDYLEESRRERARSLGE